MTDQAANLQMLLASKGMAKPAPEPAPAQPAAPVPAEAAAAAPAAAAMEPAPAPLPNTPKPDAAASTSDAVQAAAAPATEGDAAQAGPMVYKVKFGEQERELTDVQIAGTFDRYTKLNTLHAENAPVMKLVSELRKRTGMDGNQAAQLIGQALMQAAKGQGGGKAPSPTGVNTTEERAVEGRNDTDLEKEIKDWEEKNAISLPPGLRQALSGTNELKQQNAQVMQLLAGLMNHMKNQGGQAQQQAQANQQQQMDLTQQRIAGNLDAIQKRYGFADDQIGDFQQFAMARGYTVADFVDADLAMMVGQDFKNAVSSGEMERIRSVLSRREAFTGSLQPGAGGAPAAAAAPAAGPTIDPKLASMTKRVMGARSMG